MFQNYLRVTLRNLVRRRTFSILNIGGMGVGLATGLLVLFWVQHEMGFNTFHRYSEQLFRVNTKVDGFDTWDATPQPIATYARQYMPEVAMAVRVRELGRMELFKIGEKSFFEKDYGIVDSTFFQVFDFPIIDGDPERPFRDGKSIVLSESTAHRFFGLENPMGKTIEHKGATLTVTGVMKDFPDNSTYRFDFVMNNTIIQQRCIENPESCNWMPEQDWSNYQHHTWLLLQPNADHEALTKRFTEALYQNNTSVKEGSMSFSLQPLSTLHLYNTDGSPGRIRMVRIFFGIAILILLLATMNYVNLATAMATQRVKEICVRKIAGAEKRHLYSQLWMETAVILGCSLVVAILLMEIAAPYYQSLAGKTFDVGMMDASLWKVVIMTFAGIWVATGIYPTILLSNFRPVLALKGEWVPAKVGLMRKGLIILQFTASSGLLICAFVMQRQLKYMQEKELGFDIEQVFEFSAWRFPKSYDFVKEAIQQLPGAIEVTAYNGSIFMGISSTDEIKWDGMPADKKFVISQLDVAPNFLEFFNIPIVEGHGFEVTKAASGVKQVLLNETAVREMEIENTIGQTLTFHNDPVIVVGIVKDVHMSSLRQAIEPGIYCLDPQSLGTVYVKTTGAHAPELISATAQLWSSHQPEFPFEYTFLDERYGRLYKKEMQARQLFSAFSLVALLISCLGLFGLAMQAAERRTREIGIRKVLGASVPMIVSLLSKDFLKLVLIALVIASPVAWYLMRQWLSDFAYRIEISWWIFVLVGGIAIAIAFLTMSFHSLRSALTNPVECLRSE